MKQIIALFGLFLLSFSYVITEEVVIGSENNGLLKDTYVFQELKSDEIVKTERTPGSTPAIPQTTVPPSPRNKNLKGKPGPSPGMGSNNAPVKVYIFSDFQCPNCRRIIEPMKYLVRKYPKDVQVIFKQFPIPSHKKAFDAARAALAATRQDKFWEYHELLFQNMNALDTDNLMEYARRLGLDMVKFRVDFDSKSVRKQVEYEKNIADRLGITGTPGFYIGGQQVTGWASYDYIDQLVRRAINGKNEPCLLDNIPC